MIELDFTVRAGAFTLTAQAEARTPGIVGVFGPSGAGKTTLLRAVAGLAPIEGPAPRALPEHDVGAGQDEAEWVARYLLTEPVGPRDRADEREHPARRELLFHPARAIEERDLLEMVATASCRYDSSSAAYASSSTSMTPTSADDRSVQPGASSAMRSSMTRRKPW